MDAPLAADGRVTDTVGAARRKVVLAGHTADPATARSGLQHDAADVRIAALGALARLGQLDARDVDAGLTDDSPAVRRRSAELCATVPDADLTRALTDSDPFVVEAACWSAGEREEPANVAVLASLSADHTDPLVREAAVAALGAIGDPRGLGAVLRAITDKPTVRRRAVLALAPFDGPEVDAALERARTDRDWQVRQAAEDLLA